MSSHAVSVPTPLLANPDESSPSTVALDPSDILTVIQTNNTWSKVSLTRRGKEYQGWLPTKALSEGNKPDQLEFAIGGRDLLRACDPRGSAEVMLDSMCRVLLRFVSFNIVTFAEYAVDPAAPDDILVLGRYATDDGKRFDWPARWLKVPKGAIQRRAGEAMVISDIEVSFDNPLLADLRQNPVVQTYVERGVRSLLAVLYWKDAHLFASLTLARKNGNPFNETDKTGLSALAVADALQRVCVAYENEAATFRQHWRDLFAERAQPNQVAPMLVQSLCKHFRWDYVAIYRVAGIHDRFELVDQYASNERLYINKDYTQPLDKGVLGKVKRTGKPVRVADTSGRARQGYVRVARDGRSCLCYPMKVDGVVEWILDCESAEFGAFQHPDQVELGTLVGEAQKTMALWLEMRLNGALIENVYQGVIVVDRENRITRLNSIAAQLLGATPITQNDFDTDWDLANIGTQTGVRGRLLTDFGADEAAKSNLAAGHPDIKQLRLLGVDGVIRNLAASSCEAEDAFNRRIWRLSDPKIWNWVTALEYMRTTVQRVAQQTRGPLLLANALLAKASRLQPDNLELQSLLSKAKACLAKTDITYERLTAGLEVQSEPVGRPVTVDVSTVLQQFLAKLPQEDSSAVNLTIADGILAAWVDPNRLDFVLHSTLGYLLATRLPTAKITVALTGTADEVIVNVTCSVQESDDDSQMPANDNPLARAKADAQEAATNALSAVKSAIEMNRGGTWALDRTPGSLILRFTLPTPAGAGGGETVLADG